MSLGRSVTCAGGRYFTGLGVCVCVCLSVCDRVCANNVRTGTCRKREPALMIVDRVGGDSYTHSDELHEPQIFDYPSRITRPENEGGKRQCVTGPMNERVPVANENQL